MTTQFISNGFEAIFAPKTRGRCGSLIHTGVVEISISRLKARVQWKETIPWNP
jgi:hypothetical protein